MSSINPKVLIIGQYFNSESGGGITMTNLFKGWDKENLAVASENFLNPNFEICSNYYQLGSLENKKRFPFNLNPWANNIKSGIFYEKKIDKFSTSIKRVNISTLKYLYLRFLQFSSLIHYKRTYILSKEFSTWINEFSPDIIYSQLSKLELIRLVNNIHITFNLPIVIHIMDDWPTTISSKGFLKKYWQKKIDFEFRELLNKASLLFSISDEMTNEYKNRYNKTFWSFHNPINIEDWIPFSKNNWDVNSVFKILYAGRIGKANTKSIKKIAEAVDFLSHSGLDIRFDIYSPDINLDQALSLRNFNCVKLKYAVPYSQMPSLLPNYDLLALPLDFDQNSIKFAKLSIPTKASEFMISGTPILVYAPSQTALAKYVIKEKWAYLVSDENINAVINAIKEIYSSPLTRAKLGLKAKTLAVETENALLIRKKFKDAICSIIDE